MTPRTRLALAGILLLALGLRLWRLDYKSLWLDEAWTWAHTQKSFTDCITSEFSNPPGSFAIFWAGTRLLGDSEWGLRFPSALSGVVATWLLFRLGRRLFDGPTALAASLLYAASAFHLLFTQEARTFGFLACAVLASTEALVMLLEGATIGRAAYYVVSAALGLHFHYVFGFVLLAHNAIVAWSWWARGRRELRLVPWACVQTATALLFAPWFVWMLGHRGQVDTSYLTWPVGRVAASFLAFTWGQRAISARPGSLQAALPTYWPFVAGFVLIALPLAYRGSRAAARTAAAGPVTALLFAVPILLAIALALAGSVRFTSYRYLSFLCPFWLLLVTAGLRSLPKGALRLAAHVLVAGFFAESLVSYYRATEIANENWREAAQYIRARGTPDDVVCVYRSYIHTALEFYDRRPERVLPILGQERPESFQSRLRPGQGRVWLLLGHHYGPDQDVWPSALRKWLTLVGPPRRFPHPDGDVELWEFRTP